MKRTRLALTSALTLAFVASVPLAAQEPIAHDLVPNAVDPFDVGQTRMLGFQEVPVVLTTGQGLFSYRIRRGRIDWELSYSDLQGDILQSHIHIAQEGVNGAIGVFLCTNLGNGPAGIQTCPAAPARIFGRIVASDVLAIAGQGLPAGDLERLKVALRGGFAYVNIHTNMFPGGEIRGQIEGH